MKLTKNEFDILTYIEKHGAAKYTQKDLADTFGCSVGLINKELNNLIDNNILSKDNRVIRVTKDGLNCLEQYRVKKAIILAAGFSERLAPVTLETPKPLVMVNGVRLIDTLIDALIAAEIKDITVVVGYKAEQFGVLLGKYPGIKLVKNDLYNKSGNITSLFAARDQMESCYICDADMYVHTPSVINKYEYQSCFLGVPVSGTDDWMFVKNKNAVIKQFGIGGDRCCKTVFIAHLNNEDAKAYQKTLENLVNARGGKEHRWFDGLFDKKYDYTIHSREIFADDVAEVDTLDDLIKLDSSYLKYNI